MKILITILFIFTFASYQLLNAQVTTDPTVPTPDDPVTITLDITGTGLDGYTGEIYAHTGITIDGDRWQYVIGDWGNNANQPQLTGIGGNLYELEITPSIREFFGAGANEEITEICLVFRSAEEPWQQTSPDIFVEVFEPGLNVVILSPDISPYFVDPGETIDIEVESTMSNMLSLYVDNQNIQNTSGSYIQHTLTASSEPETIHWIKAVAVASPDTVADSVYYYVRGENEVAGLPAGVRDGINYIDESTVTLVIHAPDKNSIYAIGDFNDWEPGPDYRLKSTNADVNDEDTRYWITIGNLTPGEEYAFQYLIDEELRVADAYADKLLDKFNDPYIQESTYPNLKPYPETKTNHIVSVFQTDQPEYNWQIQDFETPAPTDLVIYELLLRDFVATHSFKTLRDTLSYFKRLGVNAIEVMPFNEFEGNESWGYNPSFYFAPDKYYGTKDDLKDFVDACHAEGIAVIMDMVLNHAYGQNVFARMYWDEVNNRPAENNPWFNVECPISACWGSDFDHESPATQAFVDRVTEHWLTEYKIDGFRFDWTHGFSNNSNGGSFDQDRIDIIKRMADHIWEVEDDAYVMLEHWTENSEEKVLAEYGCMLWSNMSHSYSEGTMGWNEDGKSDFSWISYQERGWSVPHVIGFMESHDEERNMFKNLTWGNSSGDYDVRDTATALERQALAANFFFTIPGPKMIWQFGERGYDLSINWPSGEEYDRLTPKPAKWEHMNDYRRKYLYHVNAALINLKKTHDVFRSTDYSLDLHLSTKSITLRGADMDVVVVGNFGVENYDHAPDWPGTGTWHEFYTQSQLEVISLDQLVNLEPGEYRLFTSQYIAKPEWLNTSVKETMPVKNGLSFGVTPNPSKGDLYFDFHLQDQETVMIEIYNLTGNKLDEISRSHLPAGSHRINWNAGQNTKPGLYFAVIRSGSDLRSVKFVIE